MKFIHTSDWHIGQELFGYDRSEEERFFFDQLCEIVSRERPDALLVSGDVYHNAMPSSSATRLYTEQMVRLHEAWEEMRIVVTAGNHDSYSRLEATQELWKLAKTTVVGNLPREAETRDVMWEKVVTDVAGKGYVIALPYMNSGVREACVEAQRYVESINKEGKPVVMMAHTTVANADYTGHKPDESGRGVIGGLDAEEIGEMGNYYDYMALGHIHCPQELRYERTARYSGSPVQVNFDEAYPHSVAIVEIGAHDEKPTVRLEKIEQKMGFYTVPERALELDEALEALRRFEPKKPGYVRLLVKVKEYIATDAQARIEELMKEKGGLRFCYIKSEREVREAMTETRVLNSDEIREMDPVELAMQFYREEYGEEMDERMVEMLKEVAEEL